MTDFSFADVDFAVRPEIPAAHQGAWERLARPGTWWTGAERVAIARAVREAAECRLCRERSQALSPLAVQGEHDGDDVLPPAALEVVHQVVNDQARLSRVWFEKVGAEGFSPGHYVEAIGVVVTVVSIDSFCRGIGAALHPLPEPEAGEPTRYRPPGAQQGEAWVPWVPEGKARGAEADLYSTPRTGNVIKALSLVPDEVHQLQDLSAAHYLAMHDMMDLTRGRTLDRRQMELVAGRVAALRECFY